MSRRGAWVGLIVFFGLWILTAVFVYPAIFNFIKDLFVYPDLGVVMAILLMFFSTGFFFYLIAFIAVIVAGRIK
jgi:hypothetical protein